MQCTVIKFSELGNRWDAGFHIFRQKWEDAARALKKSIPEDDRAAFESAIVERFKDADLFSIDMLNVIEPLCRGSFPGRKGRDDFAKAAKEYPYLAVVAVSSEAERLMKERREQLELQAKKLSDVQNNWKSLIQNSTNNEQTEDEVAKIDMNDILNSLPDIPQEISDLIIKNKFVAGVIYINQETQEITVPVNTGNFFVNDCWVVDACDWKGVETLENLVGSGEVPVPRQPDDIGKASGFIDVMPDHSVNYNKGWRTN